MSARPAFRGYVKQPRMRTTKPPIWLLMSATVSSQMALTIFLPSLPTIARDLGVSYGTAQLTLSVYLFAFAFAQLAVGPLSDKLGRRPLLLASLAVFTLGSVCCALSPTIETLLASRLIQACGACGGVVLGRAIVRDSRTGVEAPRAMGYMASSMALAPALSPLLGGQLLGFFGWRSNFWFTAACGLAVMVAVWRILGETAPKAAPRTTGVVRDYLDGFSAVLRERRFIGLMIATTCASAGFNVFFSGGPILLIQVMGVAVETFGWFTLAWAGNFVLGSLVSSRLQGRVKSLLLIPVGQGILTLGAMAMMNMEGEGVSDANAYFRKKLLRMGVVKPTDIEAEELMAEMQGKPQDPNAMYLQAAAEEATAKAAKARADTVETVASAELKRAQTLETLSKVDETSQDMAITNAEAVQQIMQGQIIQPVVR